MIVIIPTVEEKFAWLRMTLKSLYLQRVPVDSVRILIDVKPWNNTESLLETLNIPFNIRTITELVTPPKKIKRQHQMINEAVERVERDYGDVPVLLMDDDYWFKNINGLIEYLEKMQRGRFVFPEKIEEVPYLPERAWLKEPLVERNDIIYFQQDPQDTETVSCLDSKRGQNPICGHPKLFFARDFLSLGGFDTENFSHYWWSDTDLYMRAKEKFEFVPVDAEVLHADHPRYNPSMFQENNAQAFLRKHGETNKIPPNLLDAVQKQLGIKT